MREGMGGIVWSDQIDEAGWIEVSPFDVTVGSVAPHGFGAYGRVLHPASRGGEPVRWSEVSRWSGVATHRAIEFGTVAMPLREPSGPAPYDQAPAAGSLAASDLSALLDLLRPFTATADRCWFAMWDGWGWVSTRPLSAGGSQGAPDVVPAHVRRGPRMELPGRTYLLYRGPLEQALALMDWPHRQSPALFWPEDRAWCVSTEVDLTSTYVGGTPALIAALAADPRLEVLPAALTDSLRPQDHLGQMASDAVEALTATGTAVIPTPLGTVEARIETDGAGAQWLAWTAVRKGGRGWGRRRIADLRRDAPDVLREAIESLTR